MPYIEAISGRVWEDETLWCACAGEPVWYPIADLNTKMKRFPDQTIEAQVMHYKRIKDADMSFPIILCNGVIVDGVHRVVKAMAEDISHIKAYILQKMPPADRIEKGRWERVG